MIYELEIADDKAKSIIAFLKQLDFVKIKLSASSAKRKPIIRNKESEKKNLSYFNACHDWDIEAASIRHSGSNKRTKGWS